VDLELARADRRLHAFPVASGLGERPRDSGLGSAEEAENGATTTRGALEHSSHGRSLEGTRPQALKLTWRPRQHYDDRTPIGVEHEPGSGSGEAEGQSALRKRRLLRDAGGELRVLPSHALGDHPRDPFDLLLETVVQDKDSAGDARNDLDGPVVMGWAEPSRDEAQIGGEALGERTLEILGPVAHNRDPLGLETEAKRLRSEKGPVAITPLAAD